MDFKLIHTVYFVGVGGIGMSALARYFNQMGKSVIGYDKTKTRLTEQLEVEGIDIHYTDLGADILKQLNKADTLIVYTPAVAATFQELIALNEAGFNIVKRARVLGIISKSFETYAVAGTHGKTTTSSILAHVLYQSDEQCNAFIGGISSNYNSNCLIAPNANRVVVEADEFDRSFLELIPNYAILTTIDADHLDIYGDDTKLKESFSAFVNQINPSGILFYHKAISPEDLKIQSELKTQTYAFDLDADWKGQNLTYNNGKIFFDIIGVGHTYSAVEFGLPGQHNAENALAVFGLLISLGIQEEAIRSSFASYAGVKRRFDYHIRREDLVLIDDYAHHPSELKALFTSVRLIYPDKKITAIFQPHLFSRTRDFMNDFADVLALPDELFLLDIYPARELPIEGVSSEVLFDKIQMTNKHKSSLKDIVNDLRKGKNEVVLIAGAGDIDTIILPVKNALEG
ncbi:UDP-N-acetylmuramate--L-alanine ligase [Crocinitomix catalasitica]|uniref:UDP-N-acetylmuramate--L-alanine ligase n=1 Tax=Crocinitomix catalasitica TaxID=184607 RepID=UPI0004890297|nr:UDP-N-acetylmuramate--L-alanine ligase [Crocinitomix catalasitica]